MAAPPPWRVTEVWLGLSGISCVATAAETPLNHGWAMSVDAGGALLQRVP